MLVLNRKKGQKVLFLNKNNKEEQLELTFLSASDGNVRLGITAPKHWKVFRDELLDKIKRGKDREINWNR